MSPNLHSFWYEVPSFKNRLVNRQLRKYLRNGDHCGLEPVLLANPIVVTGNPTVKREAHLALHLPVRKDQSRSPSAPLYADHPSNRTTLPS